MGAAASATKVAAATRRLWYFVDDFHPSYFQKNVGVFLDFFRGTGLECYVVTNRRTVKAADTQPVPVVTVPVLTLRSVRIYLPTWQLLRGVCSRSSLVFGYAERGHVLLLLLLKLILRCRLVLKTDSCLTRLGLPEVRLTLWQRFLIELPLRYADMCLVETPAAADFLAQAWHIPTTRIVIMPNGIYSHKIDQAVMPMKGTTKEKIVLYSGRLTPIKGADLAIKAFDALRGDFPQWQLAIAGRPEDERYVAQLQHLAASNESITFLGYLEQAELYRYMYRAAIFLLTSREEGFSNTVPEALYLKDRVVATAVGDNAFFAQVGNDVQLCAPEAASITAALRTAMSAYTPGGSETNRPFALQSLNWQTSLTKFHHQLLANNLLYATSEKS